MYPRLQKGRNRKPDVCVFSGVHKDSCNPEQCSCIEESMKKPLYDNILLLIETKTYPGGSVKSVVEAFKETKKNIRGKDLAAKNPDRYILWFRDDSSGSTRNTHKKMYNDAFENGEPLFKVCILNPKQVESWRSEKKLEKLFVNPNDIFSSFERNLKEFVDSGHI